MDLNRCKNSTPRGHIERIEEWGVSILSVTPRADEEGPTWTYSIGFWQQYNHPELIIVGLEGGTAGALINEVNRRVRDKGQRFESGSQSDDLLSGGYTCFFQKVEAQEYGDRLVGNTWFYGDDRFEVVQVIWPDLQHKHPWQQDVDPSVRKLQRLLCSLPPRALQ